MLFWLFVIVLVVGITLIVLGNLDWDRDRDKQTKLSKWLYFHDSDIYAWGWAVVIISALILLFMTIALICEHTSANAYLQKYNERYNALTYKVESEACRDEFGLLNKKIIDEVQDWNEDVVYRKEMQNNFWVGIFYADIYDEFETIDYDKYAKE